MERLSSISSGITGEYLAAGELSRHGYIASVTLKNSKGVDILVTNSNATKTLAIQVKTNQGSNKWWLLDKKAEDSYSKSLFYIFVNLNNGKTPDFYIVPSKVVAKFVIKTHKKWLKTPGREGQAHNDNPMRGFKDKGEKYLNKWELLNL